MPVLDASSFPSTEVSLCLRPGLPEEAPKFLPIAPTQVSFPGLKALLWPGSEERDWAAYPLAWPGGDLILQPEANGPSSEPHGSGAPEQTEAFADGTEGTHRRPRPNIHWKVRGRETHRGTQRAKSRPGSRWSQPLMPNIHPLRPLCKRPSTSSLGRSSPLPLDWSQAAGLTPGTSGR